MYEKQLLIDFELTYNRSIAKVEERPWGYLFYNTEQPLLYDANHAFLYKMPEDSSNVIQEVINFYINKQIIPRFYLDEFENKEMFLSQLENYQFKWEAFEKIVQKWNGQLTTVDDRQDIRISAVDKQNHQEALDILCSIKEFGGREVQEKAFAEEYLNPNIQHYLLYLDGTPVSLANIFCQGRHVRLEGVATREEYRGRGLIQQIIHYLQKKIISQGITDFWVSPINEQVEKVYSRCNFETVYRGWSGHAYMGGKSIKEIREQ